MHSVGGLHIILPVPGGAYASFILSSHKPSHTTSPPAPTRLFLHFLVGGSSVDKPRNGFRKLSVSLSLKTFLDL